MGVGGAARELDAAEGAGERGASLDEGDDEAEAVERVRDVGAFVCEVDGRGLGVRNRVEFVGEFAVNSDEQTRRGVSRECKADGVGLDRLAAICSQSPAARLVLKSR